MRLIYTILFYLIVPFVFARLYWRGFKAPEYRQRWKERLAIYSNNYSSNVIWIHAVSVGEVEAVFPLIKQLQNEYRLENILITTTTPTGSARVQAVLADTVTHVYLPYDLPSVINRFLTVFNPKIAIFMEKEIWPNFYAKCSERNIPVIIINGRLSENSAKGYKNISALMKPALLNIDWVTAQTIEDKQRFIEIGARKDRCSVEGNLKFDLSIDEESVKQARDIKNRIFPDRFVLIIASTHEGEEEFFLELYPVLKQKIPQLLMMIVPRHPERFNQVNKLVKNKQLKSCMRSTREKCTAEIDVYIADTMGELKFLYGMADICFVGGSMVPVGGHNILEPAAIGIPIIFGPYMTNFKEIAENVLDLSAAIQCVDKEEIKNAVFLLNEDEKYRVDMATKAKQFITTNQGTTERIARLISAKLSQIES